MCYKACLSSMCRTSSTSSKGEGRDLVERLTIQRLRNGAAAARDELQAVLKQTKRQRRQTEEAQHQQRAQIRGLKLQMTTMERQWQVQVSVAQLQQDGVWAGCACLCLQENPSLSLAGPPRLTACCSSWILADIGVQMAPLISSHCIYLARGAR